MCDTFTIAIYYRNNTKIIEYIVLLYSLFHRIVFFDETMLTAFIIGHWVNLTKQELYLDEMCLASRTQINV